MELLLYGLARGVVALLQRLPLPVVARLGRTGGAVAYWLDARHRRMALHNLKLVFGGEKSQAEIHALARENLRRIGENYACAVKTAAMNPDELRPYFRFVGAEKILPHQGEQGPQSRIVAIGHFGNFELYARFGQFVPVFKSAATYRGLRQPSLNRLMQSLREKSGCRFFERRTEAAALKAAMSETGLLLGLLADQHAGQGGRRVPFCGHDCSTSIAPAIFALRYHCPLHTGICYRVGLGRWQIEAGDEIPTRENGKPRPVEAITLDINRAFEAAIRRDPANWFWVHNRWKPPRAKKRTEEGGGKMDRRTPPVHASSAVPAARRILVRGVNWMGDAVMTTPALQRLREAMPAAHIALLTPRKLAGLWQHHPALDTVLAFDERESVWHVARRLRREQYELALVLPNSPRSALEVFLAGIPQRIGYARPWRSWFLTQCVPLRLEELPMRKRSVAEIHRLIASPTPPPPQPIPATAHHIQQYLHLVAALGANPELVAPRLRVTDEEVRDFKAQCLKESGGETNWFGLNAGARYGPAKRWPVGRYIAAAIELHRRTGCAWLVFGATEDANLTREIVAALRAAAIPRVLDLAGRTTLRQLCAAFKVCRVLLTNDSGPMHVAAAVGTPVVVPFGSTAPELTGPGLPSDARHRLLRSDAPCAPCFLRACPIDFRCMDCIRVEAVVEAALQVTR